MFVNIVTMFERYAGCTTRPTPKSDIAKLRISMFCGVRKGGNFTNAKMIKTFKDDARMESTVLITVNDTTYRRT